MEGMQLTLQPAKQPDDGTIERIRQIVIEHSGLADSVADLPATADLWQAGMDSLATIRIIIAVEREFQVELPDRVLTQQAFQSISAISAVVSQVQQATMRDVVE
jgi:acyl carrier protein